MTDDQGLASGARRLVEWCDNNPFKPRLAGSLASLGGKYRPTTVAEDRIIMAEEPAVAAARATLRERESSLEDLTAVRRSIAATAEGGANLPEGPDRPADLASEPTRRQH